MQLLVQNCLDPSRATEIFSVPKRQIFAFPKIVRHRSKSGLEYIDCDTSSKCTTTPLRLKFAARRNLNINPRRYGF